MRLDELKPAAGSRRKRKRIGRGISAGGGKTGGRGQKGQGARTSWSVPRAFEGGQMPLTQRVPKLRGFYNRFRVEYQVVNCGDLNRFEEDAVVDRDLLHKSGLVRHPLRPVKLLAGGEAPPRVTVRVERASRAAREALTAVGGKVELLESGAEAASGHDPAASHPKRRRFRLRRDLVDAATKPAPASAAEPAGDGGGQDSSQ